MKKQKTQVIKTVAALQEIIAAFKAEGKTVGFTPTLGALHQGHMSLIGLSKKQCDITVCSIFVNPTQFNVKSDLDKYPRTYKKDLALLNKNGCDILFYPDQKAVYPKGLKNKLKVNLGGLDQELEGAFRPGHFEGVVQVVHRLLDIVKPDKLFMGQKDFQQFTIIQRMISDLKMSTKLVVCPIIREKDGLAMSSRNVRLTKTHRQNATIIHKTLKSVKRKLKTHSTVELENFAMTKLAIDGFKPEYFYLIDGNTLKRVKNHKRHKYLVAVTAVWAGEVRLIDNMIYV